MNNMAMLMVIRQLDQMSVWPQPKGDLVLFCPKFLCGSRYCSLVFGRPFVNRLALCYRSVVLSCLSVCDVRALWPNGWTDQDVTWHAGRPRPWPHCVRWGPSSPSPKGAQPPNFRPICVAAKWLHGSRCHLV